MDSPASSVKGAIIGAVLLALAGASAAGFWFGRSISTRIGSLTEAVSRMSVGELSAPVRDNGSYGKPGPIRRALARSGLKVLGGSSRIDSTRSNSIADGDEIGNLAEQLDQMRESFRQAIERLRRR